VGLSVLSVLGVMGAFDIISGVGDGQMGDGVRYVLMVSVDECGDSR
jgi:hypothetical protein